MRKLLPLLFFLVVTTNINAQDSLSGLVYGHNHSYLLSAPKGWVLDNQVAREQGIMVVFYKKGESWGDGETVMYTNFTNFDSIKNEKFKDLIDAAIKQFKITSPGIEVLKQKPIKISKEKTAMVYYFPGQTNGSYENIAFIEEKKGASIILISSRTKKGLDDNTASFIELVKSYTFLTDKVNVN